MTADRPRPPLALLCAVALGLAACRTEESPPDPPRAPPPVELRSGSRVEKALASGEVHRYRIPLRAGDLLRLVVDQREIDLVAALEDPGGVKVLEADRLINDRGLELVLAVAATSGAHTLVIRGEEGGPGRYEVRVEALRRASAAERRSAAAYRSFTEAEALPPEKGEEALARWAEALATWRELGETALEGEALARMARKLYEQGERQRSTDLYREAAEAFARAGNPRWEAITRNGAGANLLPLGEAEKAVEQYTLALALARRAGDALHQATALHGLGQAHQNQGELQRALGEYQQALALWPVGERKRPYTLHNLGVLYARAFRDPERGGKLLLEARNAWRDDPVDRPWNARTLSQLGWLALERERLAEARGHLEAALALRRERDLCGSAVTLAHLALVEEAQRKRPAADARLAEALGIVGSQPCPRSEPTVHLLAADLAKRRGDGGAARSACARAEALFDAQGDRLGRAESLACLARAARALGDRRAAGEASRQALEIIEGVRPTVLGEDHRISFFAGARSWLDAYIDLLLEEGNAEEAWATAERARARALGDLLAEAGAGLRRTAPPGLLGREKALQRQLNVLESRRLASSESKPEKLRALQAEIDARVADLESLRGEIRRRSPLYASLARSEPFSPAARRELLDPETVLLEYRLGETASTVWAVTRDGVAAFRLPPRRDIEPRALEAVNRLRSREWFESTPSVLCGLSRTLLGPVAASLSRRRVAVVADGALEKLPFAALPIPGVAGDPAACERAPALVDSHEVVSLPSAASLLLQRRLLAGRHPAPGWLAVVANPVYDPSQDLPELPGTAEEATTITAGLPAAKFFLATGPQASRRTATGGALQGFRILHFATHGTLNAEQPLLSALSFGRGGVLSAHEIYDLDLPAELVVLSACDTALGREVPGEGLVSGLPRAFLYAGASRVLVSLWKVEDQSTRDLITVFYRGLFKRGLPPARALQEAQRALRQAGRPPYQWAGFVLVGDWRPLPAFE